jgi:hypothetical protein
VDFKRGITFLFQDPRWLIKIGIGTLIVLVPILNLAAIGYSLDVMRNVYNTSRLVVRRFHPPWYSVPIEIVCKEG